MSDAKLTVDQLKKRLDTLLKAVRYRDSLDGLSNLCTTCRQSFPIKDLQCGHFIKRGNQVLKYDPHNVWPQCRKCNHFLSGAQDKMGYWIIKECGLGEFCRLIEIDYQWLRGELKPLKKNDLVYWYNYWLAFARQTEQELSLKLVPKTWKAYSAIL